MLSVSKIESTIEHLLSRTLQKSTRLYHNGVSRHHLIENSLEAFPLWVAFVQSTLQCVFLGSHQYQKYPPPQVFPICSDIPDITAMIPFPWVSFICFLVHLAVILWTKEVWVYHTPPAPVEIFPSPPCPFSESVHRLLHTFWLPPSRSWSRKDHSLN